MVYLEAMWLVLACEPLDACPFVHSRGDGLSSPCDPVLACRGACPNTSTKRQNKLCKSKNKMEQFTLYLLYKTEFTPDRVDTLDTLNTPDIVDTLDTPDTVDTLDTLNTPDIVDTLDLPDLFDLLDPLDPGTLELHAHFRVYLFIMCGFENSRKLKLEQ
jgi:hypothetical protein